MTILTGQGAIQVDAGTVIHVPKISMHGYNNDSEGRVKMTMIFNPCLHRDRFFSEMYQMLDENPDNLEGFPKLYIDNDSYSISEKDMIPIVGKK